MSRVWPTILLLCIAASAAGADKTKSGPSPRERLDAIKKEYKAAEDAFSKARDALPDTPEGNKKKQELYEAYDKDRSDRFMAAVELARGDPKSEVGFAALEWVLTIPRSKHGGSRHVQLNDTAMAILRGLPSRFHSRWVFPSATGTVGRGGARPCRTRSKLV